MEIYPQVLKTEQARVTLDDLEDLQDDMEDLLADAGEVGEIMSRDFSTVAGLDGVDDAELEAELAGLEDMDMGELEGELDMGGPVGMPEAGGLPTPTSQGMGAMGLPAAPSAMPVPAGGGGGGVDEYGAPLTV